MTLKFTNTDVLLQLVEVIGQMTDADYARPVAVLSGNTVGKHVRHILEFYELLVGSLQTGRLNYDHRKRDLRLETDTDEAIRRIDSLDRTIHRLDLNQPIQLEAALSVDSDEVVQILSSFARELHHNIEHAIHHMALIQVAIRDSFPGIELPMHFGVAYSTVQYQAQ